jgi:lysozyme C
MDPSLLLLSLVTSGVPTEDALTMVCIAKEESKYKATAINHKNRNGTKDYGLFQINSIWLKQLKLTSKDLLKPMVNIGVAVYVYNKQGLTAWATLEKCS